MHSNIAALEPVGDSTSSSVAGDDSRSVIPAVKSVVRVDRGGGGVSYPATCGLPFDGGPKDPKFQDCSKDALPLMYRSMDIGKNFWHPFLVIMHVEEGGVLKEYIDK